VTWYVTNKRIFKQQAPYASGQRESDHDQLVVLNEAALQFAAQVLRDGGTLLIKCSRGGDGRYIVVKCVNSSRTKYEKKNRREI
jgi:23S rRNA U2552 (ribose-2'-O)-methylase RlmE/FtsJ